MDADTYDMILKTYIDNHHFDQLSDIIHIIKHNKYLMQQSLILDTLARIELFTPLSIDERKQIVEQYKQHDLLLKQMQMYELTQEQRRYVRNTRILYLKWICERFAFQFCKCIQAFLIFQVLTFVMIVLLWLFFFFV